MSCHPFLLFVLAWLAAIAPPLRSEESRYLAVFSDATRVEGAVVAGWHEYPAETRLDSTTLDTPDRRLAWFRDRTLPSYNVADQANGFIEFVSGDRLPGRVESYTAPTSHTPEHLVVETELSWRLPEADNNRRIRVSLRGIRRIVFALGGRRQVTPRTLFFLDGRKMSYRSLRWHPEGLVVLTERGSQDAAFDEIDEIHFPVADSWESYCRELGKLSPDGHARLIRLETAGGLVATGSEVNFDAVARATDEERSAAQATLDRLEASQQRLETQRSTLENTRTRMGQIKERNAASFKRFHEQEEQRSEEHLKRRRQQMERHVKSQKDNFVRRERDNLRRHHDARQRLEQELEDAPADDRADRIDALDGMYERERKQREGELEVQLADYVQQRQEETRRFAADDRRRREQAQQNRLRSTAITQRNIDRVILRLAAVERELQDVVRQIQLRPRIGYPESSSDHWYHKIQPAWCLDPLWIRFGMIRTRQQFAPHEIPLSRLRPVKTDSRSGLGGIRPIRVNRNVDGSPLQGARYEHGWGFGVQADCELQFELPDCAQGFRTRVGLDRLAGDGGCARAAVFVDTRGGPPLFQSELLIGSAAEADTGWLDVSSHDGRPRRLILVADAAHKGRPPGADPLNIRDFVDWIEPVIQVDPAQLMNRVAEHREQQPAPR